jgi:DNA-binding IclR family transcriptional regulator
VVKERKSDYTNETQQNLMRVVGWLAADVTRPATVGEISEALELSDSKVRWTLYNLKMTAWVEQSGDGWRLSAGLAQIAERVRKGIAASAERYLGGA